MRLLAAVLLVVALILVGCATHRGPVRTTEPARHDGGDRAAAAVSNLWYVPGRAIVCGASAVLSGAIMTLTLGHSYDDATQIMRGGCSGPWTVQPTDIRRARH